ncbi:MAG: acyl-CoA dehydrogenase family protein [Planctomycetes bacterium]|nr:acyl-CoA dehydrogenase family protein [Planctomycetota bacterium]
MDFDLSEDLKMIRETARKVADEEIAPRAAALDEGKIFPAESMKKLAELGFCGFLAPEKYGGSGLGNLALVLALEEVNRACASTGVTLSVQNSLVASPLNRFGNEDQKQRYLPKLARGEWLGAYSLTEPGSGSDAAALITSARRDGDFWVLNGSKNFVTTGSYADLLIIFARTNPDASLKAKGVSAFLVEKTFPGFRVGKAEDKCGIRGSDTASLFLEDCRVPAANLLGQEGKGFTIAMDTLDGGRIGIATQAVGIGQACLDASVKYSKERKQFGKLIGEFEAIQWKLAEMATELDAARLLIYRAALLRDRGLPHTKEAAMAKLAASTAANRAAKEAVQIHGGVGYLREFPVERYFRDVRITELYEGTTEIQHLVIARHLLR